MSIHRAVRASSAALLALVLVGCSDSGRRDLHLLQGAPQQPSDDKEQLRKQELQGVRFFDLYTQTYQTQDAWFVGDLIYSDCVNKLGYRDYQGCRFD
ncbi:MAG TPA: hypothetical protein VHC20_06325, partial [Candidatus Paceibacterota bacterium]|nr:hypothetical protein [Candidatus Paceibacterota bacterium]